MRQVNKQILNAVDTASQNSSQVDANQLVSASFHFVFGDASAAGTVSLQASNDVAQVGPTPFTVTNWVDIPSQSASITGGSAAILTIGQCSYRWLRAVYTRSSGGSTTVVCNMFALSV